jgi:hypothetical protein
MKKNIGRNDKIARIILGILIIVLGIVYNSWWGLIGVIPLATAFINFCPLYLPFGISTCKKK